MMNVIRPQQKATVGSITTKNKVANLDFLNQPLTSMEIRNTHRTMNSTHGPFF